jgi:hypothetical protein
MVSGFRLFIVAKSIIEIFYIAASDLSFYFQWEGSMDETEHRVYFYGSDVPAKEVQWKGIALFSPCSLDPYIPSVATKLYVQSSTAHPERVLMPSRISANGVSPSLNNSTFSEPPTLTTVEWEA